MPPNIDINTLLGDPQVTALIRVVLAGLLCGLIGLEREMAGKAAGIRTYGLVGVGAAMFTVVAIFAFGSLDFGSRIVGSIITGIGFLGAGAILHTKVHIVGLTTAAGMWVAAGIGMAIGMGMYVIGVGVATILFFLLQFASPEEYVRSRRKRAGLLDAAEEDEIAEAELEERLNRTPRTLNVPQPQAQMTTWPQATAAPPPYGPWSTTAQPQRAGQTDGRG